MGQTDQVELSIQCPQPELVAYLKSKDILPQGYSPLGGTGKSNLRENDVVEKIAKKYGVQTANILLSWLVMRGINPVPKSVTPERIANNLKRELHRPGIKNSRQTSSLMKLFFVP